MPYHHREENQQCLCSTVVEVAWALDYECVGTSHKRVTLCDGLWQCKEHSHCNMVHGLRARVCLWLLPSDKLVRDGLLYWEENTVLFTLCKCRQRKTSKIFVYGRAMSSSYQPTSCQAPDSHVMQTWLFNILHFTAKFQSPFRAYGLFFYTILLQYFLRVPLR